MRRIVFSLAAMVCLCVSSSLFAQDPVKVDSKHYTVISENDQVRILKAHYGAHEKSVMHSHPAGVAVFMSDGKGKFTYADGKSEAFTSKSGEARYTPAVTHLPENTGDKAFDVIIVELKSPAKAAAKTGALGFRMNHTKRGNHRNPSKSSLWSKSGSSVMPAMAHAVATMRASWVMSCPCRSMSGVRRERSAKRYTMP